MKSDLPRIVNTQAKRAAMAAQQAESRFIANISHDLRTPLTGLLGMAKILQQEVQTEFGKTAATDLLQAGEVLLQLLNEVIDYSRCAPAYFPTYTMKFDLKAMVNNLVALFKPSAQEKCLCFEDHWDEALPHYAVGDSFRLQRILLNLLSNAIKFTHQGGIQFRIRLVEIKQQRLIIECQVTDTGIGIPAGEQDYIFRCFTRLHPSHQGQYSGPGLGLTLAKQFIEDLAGEIKVESVEGQGSTFTCLIPLRMLLPSEPQPAQNVSTAAQGANRSPHSAQSTLVQPAGKPLSVLVVEDNAIAQQAIRNLLAMHGAIVDTADNGSQALQKIQDKDYALIVMDLGLPDQSGYALAEAIRDQQQNRTVSVIVALSAHMDAENRQRCLAVGMRDAFAKPLAAQAVPVLLALADERNKNVLH